MSDATVIPLEYRTPPRPRRYWRIWKIPADAVLNITVAVVTMLLNPPLWEEANAAAREAGSNLAGGVATVDAVASMIWAFGLLVCAIALVRNDAKVQLMHRIYAWGKLLMLTPVALLNVTCVAIGGEHLLAARLFLAMATGALYALLLLRLGVRPGLKVQPVEES